MKNFFKWKTYVLVYAVVLLILNIVLVNLPLVSVFGYEFSAINAIAISFLSGIYTLTSFRIAFKNNYPNFFSLITRLSLLLPVPFMVSIINSLFTGFCSFYDGLLFYFLITAPSILVGGTLGLISFSVVKKFRWLVFIFLFIAVLMIAFLEIFFNPQVYVYNVIFGYFPGTIYDEGISVDIKLFLYRLLISIFFFGIFALLHSSLVNGKSRTIIWRRISYSLVIALTFYFFLSPMWGFSTTFSRLKNELPVRVETEHFIVHADQRIKENTIKFIAVNQEYYYKKISEFLNIEFEGKINCFIFNSSLQKKHLFGSGNADVAKPWQNSVYVSVDTWENSLEHEIAHCFAGKFGWGIFKVAGDFNPALIEGVAEACDGFYDEINIHFLASIAYKNDYKISVSNLFSGFSFFGNVSGLSYIYSGSFIKFLIEKYGVDKLKKYYQTNDFEKSFNIKIGEVEKEYEKFLDAFTNAEWTASANYYFGRQSLIQKVCPRYISDKLAAAWELISKEKYALAQKYFYEILNKTDSYSAVVGLSLICEKTDSLNSAIKILEDKIENFTGTSYEYNLMLRIADLKIQSGDLLEAQKIYESLAMSRPSVRLDILARIRLALLKVDQISDYVSGSDFDKYYLLKELNSIKYNYNSIPIVINLSETLEENYKLFLSGFEDNFAIEDFYSSYASLKLSQYMLKNFDFVNARKMAGLALRFKDEKRILELKRENFEKAEWFHKNAERVLTEMKISKNRLL